MTDEEDDDGTESGAEGQANLEVPIEQAQAEVHVLEGNARLARTAEILLEYGHYLTLEDTEEIFHFEDGIWKPGGDTVIKELAQLILDRVASGHRVREVVEHIERRTYFDREDLGPPEGTIAVENGLLDLETRELEELRPEHRAVRQLPLTFDPDAEPDHFLGFMDDFVDSEERRLLQEFVGYCLMHWTYHHHAALLLVGSGGNGKTTFLNTVAALLGEESVSSQSLHRLANNRFATADLFGKLANIGSELDSLKLGRTRRFKELTGGDSTIAEKKHRDPFEFKNRAKLLFSTNKIPETDDDTLGFFRRWRIVECTNTFPEGDPETDTSLVDRLTTDEELSGVLNWALEGFDRLRRNDGFTRLRPQEERRILWMSYGCPIARFFIRHLELEPGGSLEENQAYDAYLEFCDAEELRAEAKKDFTRKLKALAPVKQRKLRTDTGRRRVYAGIEWKSGSKFHPARSGGQQTALTE